MGTFRRLCALLLASAVLIGLPYLLLWELSWPQLDLTWQSASVHLRSLAVPPGVTTAVLMSALWAVWGLYAAALVAEAAARARGGGLRFRPLGPLQVLAATALGATVAAPAGALADTVQVDQTDAGQEDDGGAGRPEDTGPDGGGAPQTPVADPGSAVERSRTVAGFAFGSAELTGPMRDDLSGVAGLVRDFGGEGTTVRIVGHTDATGPDDVNLALSRDRADSAAEYLRGELGEDAPEIETAGAGSQDPRSGDDRAQRRIEIVYTVAAGQSGGHGAASEASTGAAESRGEQADRAEQDEQAAEAAGGGSEAGSAAAAAVGARGAGADAEPDDAGGAASAGEPAGGDGGPVVMLEVPDAASASALALAGIAGGYVLGRGGVRMPAMRLSLPRWARRDPERPALPAVPGRPGPEPGIDTRVTVELDHVPGIGITGPGARAAARRLVVNALGDAAERPAEILMTASQAVRLLGPEAYGVLTAHPCEPVRIVESAEEALEALQRELHERADDPERPAEGRPLVLVTTSDPEHEAALSGLLLHGQRRGVTAVVIGRWPLGGSCEIAEDGLITETSPPLNTLHHASWPGASQSEVVAAVRAHRHARPAGPRAARSSASAAASGTARKPGEGAMADGSDGTAHAQEAAGLRSRATDEAGPRSAAAPPASQTAHSDAAAASAGQAGSAESAESAGSDPFAAAAAPARSAKAGRLRAARDRKRGPQDAGAGTESAFDPSGFAAALTPETQASKEQETEKEEAAPSAAGGPARPAPRPAAGEAVSATGGSDAGSSASAVGGPEGSTPITGVEEAAASRRREAARSAAAERPVSAEPAPGAGLAASAEDAEEADGTGGPDVAVPTADRESESAPAGPVSPLPLRNAPAAGPASPLRRRGGTARERTPADGGSKESGASRQEHLRTSEESATPAAGALGRRAAERSGGEAGDARPSGAAPAEADGETAPADGRAGESDTATAPTAGEDGDRRRDATARAARVRRMRSARLGPAERGDGSGGDGPESGAAASEGAAAPDSPGTGTGAGAAAPGAAPAPSRPPEATQSSSETAQSPSPEEAPPDAEESAGGDEDADTRRSPRKVRKAGRGRNWRPRETT
ncbi:OmpA family protein [Streptomonospora arabica]|uniref:OmpA family protein n=1 Tax=Streptomonospora arabica TaxID=412417 RepID=A0ABV9SU55_9ACTN